MKPLNASFRQHGTDVDGPMLAEPLSNLTKNTSIVIMVCLCMVWHKNYITVPDRDL